MAQTIQYSRRKTSIRQYYGESGSKHANILEYKLKLLPQVVVFFSIFNVSLRPLKYFTRELLGIPLSQERIQEIISKASQNAEEILTITDRLAGKKAKVIEIDTTWKGLKRKFLGIIEQSSHYLFEFRSIKSEAKKVMKPILIHLKEKCYNLEIVLTDLALGFKNLIPDVFANTVHLLCNVHAVRVLRRLLSGKRKKTNKIRRASRKKRQKFKKIEDTRDTFRRRLYNQRSYEKKVCSEKVQRCRAANLLVKPNGATFVGGAGLPKDIKRLSVRLSKIRTKLKSVQGAVKNQAKKLRKAQKTHEKAKKKYVKRNGRYLYYCRLIARFKRLMYCRDAKVFQSEEKRFLTLLKAKSDRICKKFASFIEKNPRIFPAKREKSLRAVKKNGAIVSTNTVEGFFSKTRIMLDVLRNVPDTPYIRSRFCLFRYWQNIVGPLSGHNAQVSPCQRLGILKYSTSPILTICQGIEIK